MSCDGKIFQVEDAVASQSQIIKKVMDDLGTHTTIPLPLVSSNILEKVIQYCTYHAADEVNSSRWDSEFLESLDDHETLLKVVVAANYLCIKSLLDLTCKAIAHMIRGKTPQQIRRILNIQDEDDSTSHH